MQTIARRWRSTAWTFLESCTPGYYNNEGHPNARAFRDGPYGGGSIAFVAMWEAWRAAGKLEGLELTA